MPRQALTHLRPA